MQVSRLWRAQMATRYPKGVRPTFSHLNQERLKIAKEQHKKEDVLPQTKVVSAVA